MRRMASQMTSSGPMSRFTRASASASAPGSASVSGPVDFDDGRAASTIGDELAAVRLRHRQFRLELALRELRRQAQAHRASDARAPEGLVRAMHDFELELSIVRAAVANLHATAPARTAGAVAQAPGPGPGGPASAQALPRARLRVAR